MSSPLIVVLVVALGDGGEEATRLLARTVQETLGSEAVVLMREEANVDDGRMVHLSDELRADTVVVVAWTQNGNERRAHLHLYATHAQTWIDRDVPFVPEDPPDERGRALGYGIASMVRVQVLPTANQVGAPPQKQDQPQRPLPPDSTPTSGAGTPPRLAVEGRFQGAAALGGPGSSFGGDGALGYRFSRPLAVRLCGGFRGGDLSAAGATVTYLHLGGGLSWTMLGVSGGTPIALSTRLDVLALRQGASRIDGASRGARWIAGGDLVFEGAWSLLPRTAVVMGAGAEVALEPTRVFVDGREAATIAPVRLLGEVGVRVGLD